jgi:hypothetical protein
MPDLHLSIGGVDVVPFAATPLLAFQLRIANDPASELIHAVTLKAQIQIEAARRQYTREEQDNLAELFGEPSRWGQTLRTMLWTHASVVVPRFSGTAVAELQVPCSFDFTVAATKYFYGVADGDIPLCFQFSGMVFYQGDEFQVAPISWDKEAKFRLPVGVWKKLMETYYPNSVLLSLHRDTFERLQQFKVREGIPTWDEAIGRAVTAALAAQPEMVRR